MTTLSELLTSEEKKHTIVEECLTILDQEVADKSGLSGFAVKAGYGAVKGVKPGFLRNVVTDLLPEFATAVDPIYQEARTKNADVEAHLKGNAGRLADSLLAITDGKAQRSNNNLIKGTYQKLRGTAKKHVESAVPRVAKMIAKHAPT